jgi:hypothetical protein
VKIKEREEDQPKHRTKFTGRRWLGTNLRRRRSDRKVASGITDFMLYHMLHSTRGHQFWPKVKKLLQISKHQWPCMRVVLWKGHKDGYLAGK